MADHVHIRWLETYGSNGDDDQRIVEWEELGFFEKRRALAIPDLARQLRATVGTPGSAYARAVGAGGPTGTGRAAQPGGSAGWVSAPARRWR